MRLAKRLLAGLSVSFGLAAFGVAEETTVPEAWLRELQRLDSVQFRFSDESARNGKRSGDWWSDGLRHRCDWHARFVEVRTPPSELGSSAERFRTVELSKSVIFDGVMSWSFSETPGRGKSGWSRPGIHATELVKRDTPGSLWLQWMGSRLREAVKCSEVRELPATSGLSSDRVNYQLTRFHPARRERDAASYAGELVVSLDPARGWLVERAFEFSMAGDRDVSLPGSLMGTFALAPEKSPFGAPLFLSTCMILDHAEAVDGIYVPTRRRYWSIGTPADQPRVIEIDPATVRVNVVAPSDFDPRITTRDTVVDLEARAVLGPPGGGVTRVPESVLVAYEQFVSGASTTEQVLEMTDAGRAAGDEPVATSCGEICVHVALALVGRPATVEEIRSRLPTSEEGEHSFADLRAALAASGVESSAWNIPFDSVEEMLRGRVAVVHMQPPRVDAPGHFYVLDLRRERGAWLLDIPKPPILVDDFDLLEERWIGDVLVVGSPPTPASSWGGLSHAGFGLLAGAAILGAIGVVRRRRLHALTAALPLLLCAASCGRDGGPRHAVDLQPLSVDLGIVEHGSEHEREFTVMNRSDHDVRLVELRRSCGCSEAELGSLMLQPGASTTLKLQASFTGNIGEKVITAAFNVEPDGEACRVMMRARLEARSGPLLRPATIALPSRMAGEAAVVESILWWIDPPADLAWDPGTIELVDAPSDVALQGSRCEWTFESLHLGARAATQVVRLSVGSTRPADEGGERTTIRLRLVRTAESLDLPLQLLVSPSPRWVASARTLSIADVKGAKATVRFTRSSSVVGRPVVRLATESASLALTHQLVDGALELVLEHTGTSLTGRRLPIFIEEPGESAWPFTLDLVVEPGA